MKEYVHNILHENDHVKIDNFSAYTLLHKNVQKKMKKSKNILKNIKQNRYFLIVQSLNFQFFHAILNEDSFEKSTSSAFKHGIALLVFFFLAIAKLVDKKMLHRLEENQS